MRRQLSSDEKRSPKYNYRVVITEKTMVPLWLALSVIGGAAAWATTLQVQASNTATTIQEMGAHQERYSDDISAIRQDIAEIKGELKRMRK